VKPADFEYVAPRHLSDALTALSTHGDQAKILAGGQSLIPLLSMRLARPEILIDINGVEELDFIKEEDGGISIGALTRQAVAESSPLLGEKVPLVVEALKYTGHPQIRNLGTVVGCLAHHDPAAELPAVAVTLEARFRLSAGNGKERTVDAGDFFVGSYATALEPDELVTHAWFPTQPQGAGCAFVEVARRRGDFALAGVAAMLVCNPDRTLAEVRVGVTGASDRPVRCRNAEERLAGQPATPEVFAEAGRLAMDEDDLAPSNDVHATAEYRKALVGVLVERALRAAQAKVER